MTKALSKRVEANFSDFWVEDPASGCWNWVGAISKGYGRLKVNGKGQKAYRVSFEMASGKPIPAGMHVLHSCNNTRCVNPSHLRLGTHADNMRDRCQTFKPPTGETAYHAKLTQAEVDEIRRLVASGMLQREVAAMFGTTQSNVSDIVHRKSWPDRRDAGTC